MKSPLVLAAILFASTLYAQAPEATVKEDIVYGRKYGVALTMDVFTPKENRNGAGVIMVVSGGFFSSKEAINRMFFNVMLARGYVVFAVVHGSQPKFTIPEIVEDMNRAIRFIRYHAKDYGVDPDRLGIMGASAGGHLSLMMGCASREGNPSARDPVDRVSSRIAAVGCFFPPTDFLNYGKEGEVALGTGILKGFWPAFDFQTLEGNKGFVPVEDMEKRKEVGKQISPVYFVTSDDAPTLIIHGDADKLVPIQQAERMIARLKEKNVTCELVVKQGKAHGWAGIDKDLVTIADWFDRHLGKKGQ